MRSAVIAFTVVVMTFVSIQQGLSQGQGRAERFLTPALRGELQKMKGQTVPQFKAGLSREAKQQHIAQIDQALSTARVNPGLADSVRLWHSLRANEKEQLLTTGRVAGFAPAVAVVAAVVVAAAVMGSSSGGGVGGKDLQQRGLNAQELDAIDALKPAGFGGTRPAAAAEVKAELLDYR